MWFLGVVRAGNVTARKSRLESRLWLTAAQCGWLFLMFVVATVEVGAEFVAAGAHLFLGDLR